MITMLVGGARSGKSSFAVEAARRVGKPTTFVATAEPFDDDLAQRIVRHRHERPPWPTVEEPLRLAEVVAEVAAHSCVVVDCLTVWVGNLFHHLPDPTARASHYDAFEQVLRRRHAELDVIAVTNEVGLGLHPDTALGREYRDELGRLNQRICRLADRSLFLVAGRALPLLDPWDVWP